MSDAVELRKIVKQLQTCSTPTEYLNVLDKLKTDFSVNEAILRESKAGLAVGKLRAHDSKQVADAAKLLVKKWKTDVEKSKKSATLTSKPEAGTTADRKPSNTPAAGAAASTTPAQQNFASDKPRTAKTDGVTFSSTGDKTRDKCAELVYDSLALKSGFPTELISQRAKAIEVAIYNEFGNTSAPYKSKIRSIFVSLKDNANASLRESVVSGELPVSKFTKMSSADMASEERKAANRKIEEENFHKSLGAEEQQAETEAFQCGRCKQRKCRYRQAQTRSADEPMTTFVTCTVCGNRWKFS